MAGAAASMWAPAGVVPVTGALGLLLLIRASNRPTGTLLLAATAVGALVGPDGHGATCAPHRLPAPAEVVGRFLAAPTYGSAPFETVGGCGPVTVVVADRAVPAGVLVRVAGRWEAGRVRPWIRARAVDSHTISEKSAGLAERSRWSAVRWRATLVERIERLYGERAPLVTALTLARREGLDPVLRDRFARAGVAHLLAISGFHVGVLAAAALALLRMWRVPRRIARVGAALACASYVLFIGAPSAASRAGLIVVLSALSMSGGRRPARWGPLGAALLLLVVVEPRSVASAGFQLSFLGAAGLVLWSGSWAAAISRASGGRVAGAAARSVAAGVAATVATLPAVAWHFEQVSLVGVPVTLLATPLVSTALPGAVLSILIEPWLPTAAAALAGGVDLLLLVLEVGTTWIGGQRWASTWVSPLAVAVVVGGVALGVLLARHPRVGRAGRHRLVLVYGLCATVAWPLAASGPGWGTLTATFLDVGQGDAILLRSPRGGHVLVDTGPPADGDDAAHPVVRALRRRGIRRLDALVLTHPDADHIGGAAAVLRTTSVGTVVDPALVVGKDEYAEVLDAARAHGVRWVAAGRLDGWAVDGLRLRVRHPTTMPGPETEANDASVVLRAELGAFSILLTGDVGKEVERGLLPTLEPVSILKVGHHGSDTSTGEGLLRDVRPHVAVITVGRRNRYGHPHPAVLARLEARRVRVYRTDLHGDITVRGRSDGRYDVSVARREGRENRR